MPQAPQLVATLADAPVIPGAITTAVQSDHTGAPPLALAPLTVPLRV